jgi:CheY-like chemotaxis protein
VIDGSAKSLLTVVNDILDFSKLEAGKYELSPQRCSLKGVIGQTVGLFEPRATEKGLRLRVVIDDSVPSAVLLDTDRLRQVLSNLLSNAIKFTDNGEVRVFAGMRNGEHTNAPVLGVRVEDTGVGIGLEARGKLFQAFSQVDGSTTRHHEGTGLGLVICRRLVELMGGSIDYDERPGGGSVFFFHLPIVACSEEPPVESTAPEVQRFESSLPVLVVDDNEINQMVCLEMLEELGLEVYVVSDGPEALDAVLGTQFALVLMDCQMPGMDGYQTTQAIRERETAGERLPIIACTAHALEEERRRVLDAGMDAFLAKPIEPLALRRELSKWLKVSEVAEIEPSAQGGTEPLAGEYTEQAPSRPVLEEPTEFEELDASRAPSSRILRLFIEQTPGEVECLRRAATDGKAEDVKALAHKLKGSAGSIGAKRLAAACDRLQIHAPNISAKELPVWVDLIERLHTTVQARLGPALPLESSAP